MFAVSSYSVCIFFHNAVIRCTEFLQRQIPVCSLKLKQSSPSSRPWTTIRQIMHNNSQFTLYAHFNRICKREFCAVLLWRLNKPDFWFPDPGFDWIIIPMKVKSIKTCYKWGNTRTCLYCLDKTNLTARAAKIRRFYSIELMPTLSIMSAAKVRLI